MSAPVGPGLWSRRESRFVRIRGLCYKTGGILVFILKGDS
jgi:hypothetical protein